MKYQRRTDDDRIAGLNAKIEGIRARAARKAARANPVVRQVVLAVKAIDMAAGATTDAAARKALGDAREPLSAWLALEGLTVATHATKPKSEAVPQRRGQKRRNNKIADAD